MLSEDNANSNMKFQQAKEKCFNRYVYRYSTKIHKSKEFDASNAE